MGIFSEWLHEGDYDRHPTTEEVREADRASRIESVAKFALTANGGGASIETLAAWTEDHRGGMNDADVAAAIAMADSAEFRGRYGRR